MRYRTGSRHPVSAPSTAPPPAAADPPYITTASPSLPPSFLLSHLLRLLNVLPAHLRDPVDAKRLQPHKPAMPSDKPAPAEPAPAEPAPTGDAYTALPPAASHTLKDVLCSAEARGVRSAGVALLHALAAFVALALGVLVGYVEERQGVAKASHKDAGLAARSYGVVCRAAPGVQRVALSAGEFGVTVLAKMRSFSGPGAQSVVGPVARAVMGVLPDDARRAVRAACDDQDGGNK